MACRSGIEKRCSFLQGFGSSSQQAAGLLWMWIKQQGHCLRWHRGLHVEKQSVRPADDTKATDVHTSTTVGLVRMRCVSSPSQACQGHGAGRGAAESRAEAGPHGRDVAAGNVLLHSALVLHQRHLLRRVLCRQGLSVPALPQQPQVAVTSYPSFIY